MALERCSPIEMRKALTMADAFKQAGVDFVPVPVFSQDQKDELLLLMSARVNDLETLQREGE